MTKDEIEAYWLERYQLTAEFYQSCKERHREKLPKKIERRIKREMKKAAQPMVTTFELFQEYEPPKPNPVEIEVKVRDYHESTERHREESLLSMKQKTQELLDLLEDGEDYDFKIQYDHNLDMGYWLERAHKFVGDGTGYESDLADLREKLAAAIRARENGKYMPDAFILHLQKKVETVKKALALQKRRII